MRTSGWKQHSATAKHHRNQQVLLELKSRNQQLGETLSHNAEGSMLPAPGSAILSLLEKLLQSDYGESDQDVIMDQDLPHNPFEDMRTIDNIFLDHDGDEIMFSAGNVLESEAHLLEIRMDRHLAELDYCDHTLFAEEEPGSDAIFLDASTGLHNTGEFICLYSPSFSPYQG